MKTMWLLAAGLAAAVPALAASPEDAATRQAKNWDALHKLYPPRALAAGEEGLVGFVVQIDDAGSPTQCRVTHTSGHPLLDEETCRLIMVNATFKRPEGTSLSQKRFYEGVVNWKLPTTPLAVVPEIPKPIAAAAAPEKLICKRTPRVGSNAAFDRTCMTRPQWEQAAKEQQRVWDELQGRRGASVCDMGVGPTGGGISSDPISAAGAPGC